MKIAPVAAILAAALGSMTAPAWAEYIDLGGPATGYFAVSNFKNSSTQNGIEGKDSNGNFDPSHNGLPDFANYQMANGNYTAVIASPLSAGSDYTAFGSFGSGTFNGDPIQINNQVVSQPDFSTLSVGRIDYAPITGVGTEVVSVANLTFDFNTFEWDGSVTAEPRSNFQLPNAPINISPLSPVYTPFNDGSGAGNAQLFYDVSIDNVTGSGVTFQDGNLVSMDISGDVTIDAFV
ncbi:MAG: hypothetical protein AAGA03_01640, partial [Planctomycetota bacterium]